MDTRAEVSEPLDVIQFIAGNKSLYNFLGYLFRNAAEFNEEHEDEMGENFFPVISYSSSAHAYNIEYEFFVEIYIKFAREIFGVDGSGCQQIYSFLYKSIDVKITRARYLFFVGVLGYYFKLGNGYYNDFSKNYAMIYFDKLVQNDYGVVARSNMIMVRDFVDEHLDKQARIDDLKKYELAQVAYGKNKIKSYINEHDLGQVPKIYNLSII